MYSLIMDDVIENCQTTFEEDGVAQQTLEDLRSVGFFVAFPPPFFTSVEGFNPGAVFLVTLFHLSWAYQRPSHLQKIVSKTLRLLQLLDIPFFWVK